MRILMLGNSFTFTNNMPQMLADLTGAEVIHHTRGGARLSEQLNPSTRLGSQTQAALQTEKWDYVVLQEMSHGPITSPKSFFSSVEQLCGQIRANGAVQFCSPPGPIRRADLSWRARAGTTTRWPRSCPRPTTKRHGKMTP